MEIKIYNILPGTKKVLLAAILAMFSGWVNSQITYTFNFTGSVQAITLSPGNYSIECWGANGGWGGNASALTGTGGIGGYSSGIYAVTSPTTLYVYVGGVGQSTNTTGASVISAAGGWNGGGGGRNGSSNSNYRGGGGGGTDVRTTQNSVYSDRVIVAGGGGGAGGSTSAGYVGSGGNGGGTQGQDGVLGTSQVNHNGKGGTQTAGGTGGVYSTNVGVAGGFGTGGDGGGTGNTFPAGGGGGGWYGGGGGATQGGGGGGGSSYTGGVTSGTTIMYGQPGYVPNPDVTGNGLVLIKELCSISLYVSGFNGIGTMCPGNTLTITTNAISNYSWTNGNTSSSLVVAPTSNTVYGLTATSPSNCTSSAQVSVTISPSPTISITNNSPIVCLGDQAAISVSGADSYTWNTSSTSPSLLVVPTQYTTYSVTGSYSLSNCSSTETVSVDVFTPTLAVSGSTSICKGQTATLTANTAGAINYNWSNGLPIQSIIVSPPSHAIYVASAQISTLNITCTAINSIQVLVHPKPIISAFSDRSFICTDESVVVSGSGGTTYNWTWGSQTATGSSIAITPSVTTNLIIYVTGTDANACSNTSWVSVIVDACTGIAENYLSDALQISPNPSHGTIRVSYQTETDLQIISQTGQFLRSVRLDAGNNFSSEITDLSDGIYFVKIQTADKNIYKKIVVTR